MSEHQCPVCGEALEAYTQTYPAKYNIPDRTIGTCRNRGCAVYNVTLAVARYTTEYLQANGYIERQSNER